MLLAIAINIYGVILTLMVSRHSKNKTVALNWPALIWIVSRRGLVVP